MNKDLKNVKKLTINGITNDIPSIVLDNLNRHGIFDDMQFEQIITSLYGTDEFIAFEKYKDEMLFEFEPNLCKSQPTILLIDAPKKRKKKRRGGKLTLL